MDKQATILRIASTMFDVAGAVHNILILGLETRPDRNLDAFETDGKTYKFHGFHAHFTPKIEALMERILHLGQTATPVNCADVKLKQLAVMAGLGQWSKNSMVMHARFGLRLRFIALQVDFSFETTPNDERATFTGCANCDRCIHACPCNALVPFAIPNKTKCQAYKDLTDPTRKTRCDLCVRACPANGGACPANGGACPANGGACPAG